MTVSEERDKRRKGLIHSTVEGIFAGMMIAFGSNFVSAFAVKALGSNALKNSMIIYLPPFLLSVSQIFSGWMSDKTGKRKKIVLICVLFQALSWIVIFWFSYLTKSVIVLITLFTFNTVIGYFGNTPWTSWLGAMIPERLRGKYFGNRGKILNAFMFLSTLGAGSMITLLAKVNPFLGFGISFHLAAIFRFLSFIYLYKQFEPKYIPPKKVEHVFSIKTLLEHKNYLKFLIFNFFLYFAVSFASPLFIIYTLQVLKFSYLEFTLFNLASMLMMSLFSPFWGKLRDKNGSLFVFKLAVFPIFSISMIWYFTGNFYLLIISMFISGLCWSGVKIASLNVFYDNVSEKKRNRVYGVGSIFVTAGAIAGSISGGIAVDNVISIKSAMLLSSIARLILPLLLFTGFIKKRMKNRFKINNI